MIKAIVFDLGGVLFDLDTDACIRAVREALGFEKIVEILDKCHQKGIIGQLESGDLSADEFRAEVLRDSRPGAVPADVDRAFCALLADFPQDKADLIRDLSKRYALYILTNNNPITMVRSHEMMEERGLDWQRVFRAEFVSCEMKMLKPSREIYAEMVRRVGLPAEEILFIDDSQNNVDAASALGIRAVCYPEGTPLRPLVEAALC